MKKEAKILKAIAKLKSNNYMGRNKKNYDIAIGILEK